MGGLGQLQNDVSDVKPWKTEPDTWVDTYKGLTVWAVRSDLLTWCAYVEIHPMHPLYGCSRQTRFGVKNLDDRTVGDISPLALLCEASKQASDPSDSLPVELLLKVHGGVSYAGDSKNLRHSPENVYYAIGFDCAHADDLVPQYDEIESLRNLQFGTYRDLEYVKEQVCSLAQQVLDFPSDPTILHRIPEIVA